MDNLGQVNPSSPKLPSSSSASSSSSSSLKSITAIPLHVNDGALTRYVQWMSLKAECRTLRHSGGRSASADGKTYVCSTGRPCIKKWTDGSSRQYQYQLNVDS